MIYISHTEIKIFWSEIQPLLLQLNLEIEKSIGDIFSKISNNSNESLPLNGYLSLARSIDDNELAIFVNLSLKENTLKITSDICMEDGRIIAEGPSAELRSNTFSIRNRIISDWINKFSLFINREKPKIIKELLHGK